MTKIKLGGNEYKLAFTLNSFIKFEDETGKSLMDENSLTTMSARDLRALLWAAIQSDMTVEEVGELITPSNLSTVNEKLTEAFEESTPAGKPQAVAGKK